MLRINVDEIINFLKKKERKYKRVLLHAPNGLRDQLIFLSEKISSETSIEIGISGERSFGSCDIPFYDAERLNADLIIHLGHTPFPYFRKNNFKKSIPVQYFQVYDDREINEEIYNNLKSTLMRYDKIGVVFSIQYYNQFRHLVSRLKSDGLNIEIGEPNFKEMKRGQVLGCHVISAKSISNKVDVFLVVSGGKFHALGVGLWTGVPTYLLDIPANKIINMEKEIKKTRSLIAYKIYEVEKAKKIGVIISTKSLQYDIDTARYILNEIKKRERKAYLIILREITPDNLLYFPSIDAFIQTACPRISIDDISIFNKPILNTEQFMILIGRRKFEEIYPWRERKATQGKN